MDIPWDRHRLIPVLIHLKDPSWFPHQKQYPLRPEVEGPMPIIKDLKRQGLLIECSSPYTTPILNARKGPNKWMLEDLYLINETVVPLHAVIPNPYMLYFFNFRDQCISSFFNFYLLFIYSYVHTLFGSFLPPAPCPLPPLFTPPPLTSRHNLFCPYL
jgi:hypothetical protein